jgi:HPt (histidine-containing phosphotransfer) domain-containing protein
METETKNLEKIVNLDYLTQLSKGNTKFVKEMVKIFLSENPEEINALENGIQRRDFDAIKATAHKLRSTIPFIGLDKVIEKEVSQMEELAESRSGIEKMETLFSKIKEKCERAWFELQPV